jgi:tetratricopeptide (TPR) repeat protein
MTGMTDLSEKLLRQALQARRDHRFDDAKRDLIEAVALCRAAGIGAELARALADLGQIERDLGHGDAALRHYEEAVSIYRVEGDALKLAHTVRHVGDIHRQAGRAELAEPCYHEALSLYRCHDRGHAETPPLDLANAIRGLAILKFDAGDASAARALWEEARNLYAATGVEAGVKESDRRLALLAQERTKPGS